MSKQDVLERRFSSENFWQRRKKLVFYSAIAALLILVAAFFLLPASDKKQALTRTVIPISWYQQYFSDETITRVSIAGAEADPDKDGLTNKQEYLFGTNPMVSDTDRDGLSDGAEVAAGTDPTDSASPVTSAVQSKPSPVDNFVEEVKNQLSAEGVDSEAEMNNFLKLDQAAVLPTIPDSDIKLVPDSDASLQEYQLAVSKIINEFSSGGIDSAFGQAFSADSLSDAKALSEKFASYLARLRELRVPKSSVETQKNTLIFFGALKKIADEKLAMLENSEDLSGWSEIIHQLKIISIVGGEDANFTEADFSGSGL
ncbi:MAG: thrombospondin type 3 repeat-containing protein [Patescibacteria group bacterium]|nr:thrombospondin type 3 repeat-containing protein [Patescibacteria group bacterium]